jgi:hypothetical protein
VGPADRRGREDIVTVLDEAVNAGNEARDATANRAQPKPKPAQTTTVTNTNTNTNAPKLTTQPVNNAGPKLPWVFDLYTADTEIDSAYFTWQTITEYKEEITEGIR